MSINECSVSFYISVQVRSLAFRISTALRFFGCCRSVDRSYKRLERSSQYHINSTKSSLMSEQATNVTQTIIE
jgi:hypothetical protein